MKTFGESNMQLTDESSDLARSWMNGDRAFVRELLLEVTKTKGIALALGCAARLGTADRGEFIVHMTKLAAEEGMR